MNLNLVNSIFNSLNENKFVEGFINELSNYLKNDIENTSKILDVDDKWNNLSLDDLTLYDEKIITKFRDEMLIQRSNILQNYAKNTKENGDMFYIYDKTSNEQNSYNLCDCNSNGNNKIVTKGVKELPIGSNLGSVLRKQGENFILDEEATKNIGKQINTMIKEKIEEQNQYLNSKRIDGHIYEVAEKYLGRIWLYDLNNVSGGGVEGIEEIKFSKDLYESAKKGDLFIYKNGKYLLKE